MNQNTNKILIFIIIILAAALAYFAFFNNRSSVSNNQTSNSTPTGNNVIRLENTGINFELPKGFTAYQREGFEGGYATIVSIGKETSPGHIRYAAFELKINSYVYDQATEKTYTPHEYIDVVYKNQTPQGPTKYVELFGNKAVEYESAADGTTSIVGFIKPNQSKMTEEFLVEISSHTYGSGAESDQKLFDTIVNSLKINK